MKISAVIIFLLALFALLPVPAFSLSRDPLTANLPSLEVIPGASWYWVGEHMAIDGLPMSIKMFSYPGTKDDVVKFYRELFKSKGHGSINENLMGDRQILSYELNGYHFSIQFQQKSSGIEGKLVVSPSPLDYPKSRATELPLPPRANVYSKVESLDMGRREQTISLDCPFNIQYVVDFYENQLKMDRWTLFSRSIDEKSAVVNFQRGGELLQLIAKPLQHNNSGASQVLIHWIH